MKDEIYLAFLLWKTKPITVFPLFPGKSREEVSNYITDEKIKEFKDTCSHEGTLYQGRTQTRSNEIILPEGMPDYRVIVNLHDPWELFDSVSQAVVHEEERQEITEIIAYSITKLLDIFASRKFSKN